jgi:hypothetical protein
MERILDARQPQSDKTVRSKNFKKTTQLDIRYKNERFELKDLKRTKKLETYKESSKADIKDKEDSCKDLRILL